MGSLYPLSELMPFFSREDLVKDLIAQLNKDLMPATPFELEETQKDMAYKSLYEQLYPLMMYWCNHQPEKMLQVLYRVDLPEERIRKEMASEMLEKLPEILTDLVLKRTLQKVCIRNHFKKKEKGD